MNQVNKLITKNYVSDLIEKLYPENSKKLQQVYPEFWETARKVGVVNWQEKWQVGDVNPEIIEKIRELDRKLEEGKITEEEYKKEMSADYIKKYSSRVEGISFIKEKLVAFRDELPSFKTIIHEIGHIHYDVNDEVWNASQGGAEILFWLGLNRKYKIAEENVRRYIEFLKKAGKDETYIEALSEIVEKIYPLLKDKIVKAFYPIMLFMGTLPNGLYEKFGEKTIQYELNNPIWTNIIPLRKDVWMFLIELVEGLKYYDPFCMVFSKELGFTGGE